LTRRNQFSLASCTQLPSFSFSAGHTLRAIAAPGALRSHSCCAPFGFGLLVPKRLWAPVQNSALFGLGAAPSLLRVPRQIRATKGKLTCTRTTSILLAFSVPIRKPAQQATAPPSLHSHWPTKSSWKNEAGSYESRTEWHRIVAWGKLAESAAKLSKGAHIEVEGELRHRTYPKEIAVGQKAVAVDIAVSEIHVRTLRKLDRSSNQTESEVSEEAPE
jgi:single-strand DNA-binding protein